MIHPHLIANTRRGFPWSLVAVAMLALATAACNESAREQESVQIGSQRTAIGLPGTDWILSSINGQPPLPGSNVTLKFDSATAGGYSGCNWYGGPYSVRDSQIDIGQIAGTARACMLPDGAMDQEQRLYHTLGSVASFSVVDSVLQLRDSTNAMVLEFRLRPRFAMNPADLVGTRWTLLALNADTVVSTPPITLVLSDSETSGFGGCRNYTGTYSAVGDEIRFPSITMSSSECSRGVAAQRREEQLTTDLSETSHYRMTADSLQLFTYAGRSLVFLRQR